MVSEQGRVLISTLARPLEPRRKTRMKAGTFRRGQASVRDFTSKCVLNHELALAGERGAGAVADEVALLEQAEVRLNALQQLVDGT